MSQRGDVSLDGEAVKALTHGEVQHLLVGFVVQFFKAVRFLELDDPPNPVNPKRIVHGVLLMSVIGMVVSAWAAVFGCPCLTLVVMFTVGPSSVTALPCHLPPRGKALVWWNWGGAGENPPGRRGHAPALRKVRPFCLDY